jgi:hypothetical protein
MLREFELCAQSGSTTFNKTYAVVTLVREGLGQLPTRVIEVEDGYIFSCDARGLSYPEGSKIALFKVDYDGNELWRWEDSTFTTYMFKGNIFFDNNFIYLSYSKTKPVDGGNLGVLHLNKFNLNGELVWAREYDNNQDVPLMNFIDETKIYSNHIYISYSTAYFTGNPPPNNLYNEVALLKFDTSGNIIWSKKYDSGGNIDYNYSLVVAADSTIYLSGITNGLGASGWRGHLIKTDMEGNMIWQKIYPEIGNGGLMTINYFDEDKFILTGSNYNPNQQLVRGKILKIDNSGSVNQSLTHVDNNPDGIQLYRTSQISSGDLVSVGISRINNSDCGLILKSDVDGNIKWIHRYDYGPNSDFFINFIETTDNHLLVIGKAFTGFETGADAWLLKLDSNGCLEPGCLEVGINEAEQEMGITIYPNPTQDRLFIKLESSQKKPLNFSLYNLQGKLIIQEQLVAEYESFDLSNLVSGVYLVNIVDGEGKKVSRKIIKN